MNTLATGTTTAASVPPCKLTTIIQDPINPGEPWTIETTQGEGEALTVFIARHDMAVAAIRKLLRAK